MLAVGLGLLAVGLFAFAQFLAGLLLIAIAIPMGVHAGRVFGRQELRGDIR